MKTLKDLKKDKDEETKYWAYDLKKYWDSHFNEFINDKLKAEAVKWVKFGGCEHQIKWIKNFFNLTEEDLKKEQGA